jgi:hypothetical protein
VGANGVDLRDFRQRFGRRCPGISKVQEVPSLVHVSNVHCSWHLDAASHVLLIEVPYADALDNCAATPGLDWY